MACRRLMPNHYPNHHLLILNGTLNNEIRQINTFATIVGLSVLRYIQMADIICQVIMR